MQFLGMSKSQMAELEYEIVESSLAANDKVISSIVSIAMPGMMGFAVTRACCRRNLLQRHHQRRIQRFAGCHATGRGHGHAPGDESISDLRVFQRHEVGASQAGQKTFEALDKAINEILDECYQEAKRIVTQKRDAVERVTQALLGQETLSREEFVALI